MKFKEIVFQDSYFSDSKSVLRLKSKYLHEPSVEPYNLLNDKFHKASSYSWMFINTILKYLFENKRGGFFVEAGALDGEYLSNTLLLELEKNWTGILIEPNPFSYKNLKSKNRKAWISNSCISDISYPKNTTFVCRDVPFNYNNSKIDPWQYRGGTNEIQYNPRSKYQFYYGKTTNTLVTVECFPIRIYLKALEVTVVDLVILDLQGPEKNVLLNFPFEEVYVKVFIVESSDDEKFDYELELILIKKNFVLIACDYETNYVFINKNEFASSKFRRAQECPWNVQIAQLD